MQIGRDRDGHLRWNDWVRRLGLNAWFRNRECAQRAHIYAAMRWQSEVHRLGSDMREVIVMLDVRINNG